MDLPSATEFQLLSLALVERSGREIAKLFEKEAGRVISYGTLYTTYRRLRERGWVTVRDDEVEDGRVRWFHVTAAGKTAIERARQQYTRLAEFGLGGGLT